MKKTTTFFILIAAVCLLVSCGMRQVQQEQKTDEERAKDLITTHMQQNLNDPSSYEPVSFGQLDSVFSAFIDTEEGRRLWDLERLYRERSRNLELSTITERSPQRRLALIDSSIYYLNKSAEYEMLFIKNRAEFVGDHIGWRMNHRFRAKNAFGAIMLSDEVFHFDKDISRIVTSAYLHHSHSLSVVE